ncbi:P-loop NTPase fold protein [Pseudomonas germanica]|uniref:KAP NTPase domain-containing protein n=1 Tax=Pseudomonas germanica TaxID=2815720 RepID=A0ABX8YMW8_9PSED|nr:P-loop NTPase fold protein [Pseudomonas germanica]QYY81306.1 hypothetical protein J0G10_26950 [Pseudomonas germanica]WPN74020.1 P-loop NTPase fold protein [Pseudomonas germanica]
MRFSEYSKGLRASEITPLLQFFIAGVLIGEALSIGQIIGALINRHIATLNIDLLVLSISGLSAITCIFYAVSRGACKESRKLIDSSRIDLLIVFSLGFFLSCNSDGLANEFYAKYLERLTFTQLFCLYISPVIIAWIAMIKASLNIRKKEICHPYFMSDRDIEGQDDDLLDFGERATIFAERVLNGGSSDSLVFGIDAPWGTGKSSFVNFCCNYWRELPDRKTVIHRFEPLRYDEGVDLTEKFIDDLISTIQEQIFAPALRPLFKRYENLVADKKATSFLDIRKKLSLDTDTIHSTLKEMDYTLRNISIRIIVIVDDLDRLHWSSAKSILFSIKRSFMLSNISYVLCYDTDNIKATTENPDSEKTLEFLEKFINIKTSLFLSSNDLTNYLYRYFDKAIKENLNISTAAVDKLKLLTQEIAKIFQSDDFHKYKLLLGDIRKIKRLINALILLDIENIDFKNSDTNTSDLLHLTLIYVNHPKIFRKIYDCESSGKSGFFKLQESNNKYDNHPDYKKYITTLTEDQNLLLSKLFDSAQFNAIGTNRMTEAEFSSRACSPSNKRPLEKYLYIIAKLSRPVPQNSYQYYENLKEELFTSENQNEFLKELFTRKLDSKEENLREFWRVTMKYLNSFGLQLSNTIIDHFIEKMPQYSLTEKEDFVGFRRKVHSEIMRVLNNIPNYSSEKNNKISNKNHNIISDIIFGNSSKGIKGVLHRLTQEDRGILGFYDLLHFRLNCSVETVSGLVNLWQSVSYHANDNPNLSLNRYETTIDQMREISQITFNIFKNKYIKTKTNIFKEIDQLSHSDLLGSTTSGKLTEELETELEIEKNYIKLFISSQLSNTTTGECGSYDEEGKNIQHGIHRALSDYFFSVCFNPELEASAYIYFADMLLITLDSGVHSNEPPFLANIDTAIKILGKETLAAYWLQHQEKIIQTLNKQPEKTLFKTFFNVSYSQLPSIYNALNHKFLLSKE